MMKHKRTMLNISTMAPKALIHEPLSSQIVHLNQSLAGLQQDLHNLQATSTHQKQQCETLVQQAYMYGQWTLEATAVRRGVRLSVQEEKKDPDLSTQLRGILDRQMANVDRVERMPSPYLWQVLDDMEYRLGRLQDLCLTMQKHLVEAQQTETIHVTAVVETQHQALAIVAAKVGWLHRGVEQLRQQYRLFEKDENVLEKAELDEINHQRSIDEQLQRMFLQASAPAPGAATPTPAPTGFFGPTSSASPAPTTSAFAFGGTTTPAPAGFGTTASASTAPGPLFGSGTAAPAPGAFNFSSSTATPTPKKKSGSRSSSRLRR
jgi:hypothetical protein